MDVSAAARAAAQLTIAPVVYRNPPTVVAVLVTVNGGLLMIRRSLLDDGGYGQLALPGGYQNWGETWQEAGAREVFEETGLKINPDWLVIERMVTVREGQINLLIAHHNLAMPAYEACVTGDPDAETLSVETIFQPVETAFPVHTEAVRDYFLPRRRHR